MNRTWHPYTAWEDWRAGVWRHTSGEDRREHLQRAVAFTGDAEAYGAAMIRVTKEWPMTCEHHLSDDRINRRAWIGHAAACLAHGIPEDVTRAAWGMLTDQQRKEADDKAEEAISAWESIHAAKNQQLHLFMGESWLSARHTG